MVILNIISIAIITIKLISFSPTRRFFWIGLYGNVTTRKFTWPDSTQVDFSYWATGFPGLNEGVTCTRIREFDLRWETSDCTARLNFLCEDPNHKSSHVVSTATKLKGIFLGLGVIGGLLLTSCLLLQLPCCRSGVTEKISRIGFGTKDADKKLIIS
ncbi:macrophage mannose receptor 1-like [Elysia marginata]|uniref:Macrophage mannose receptor 1-like n=1 Tax=Elysia marginata TaxID=1093978 RepID=A0AAV4F2N4_9GAST|nr:macrophage mannose receptor 1-like [Elysia marginata]